MKRSLAVVAVFCIVASIGAQTPSSSSEAVAKIRDEGLNHSQVNETMFWLTDAYGPRLNGSPAFEQAGDWAVKQLQEWGVANVHKERWKFGKRWSLSAFHATMTAPQVMPIIGMPRAWSTGTNGVISADVVRVSIANEADAAKYKGQLRGKIVLTQPAREVHLPDRGDGVVLRYADKDGKWAAEALTVPAASAGQRGAGQRGGGQRGGNNFDVNQFYKSEGVVALFDRGGNTDIAAGGSDLSWQQQHLDAGTIFVQAASSGRDGAGVPEVTLAVEHYNRMVRLLDHNLPVKVELNVQTKFDDEPATGSSFNVVGEIPGSDLADQIVLLGAHFDSWHGATGASDNATGSTAMMEALRIIKGAGLKPRRTIRIGLWGGEEEGELGSRNYVTEHLGAGDNPKPEMAKTVAYFNLDNGTGRIRGIWMQSNTEVEPTFRSWAEPLQDLGVDIFGPRSVSQTDHTAFDSVGVPAFQFVQERLDYNSRIHHSNMDFYDHVQFDDLKEQATVAAVFAWQAANADQPLPHKSK
jgi:carboxypeptidase Q